MRIVKVLYDPGGDYAYYAVPPEMTATQAERLGCRRTCQDNPRGSWPDDEDAYYAEVIDFAQLEMLG